MENVADACGIVFQGVQRYETGINSVNVERFLELAIAIGFSPTEFLNEIVDSNSFEVVNVPDLDLDDINILEAFRRVPPEDKKILLSLAKHFAEKAETNR